jgi:hypothetical protein
LHDGAHHRETGDRNRTGDHQLSPGVTSTGSTGKKEGTEFPECAVLFRALFGAGK